MKWILIDVALALLALAFLAVLLLGLWRKVKQLSRTVAHAGEVVGQATEALALAQGDGPLGQAPAASTPRTPVPARREVPGRSPGVQR